MTDREENIPDPADGEAPGESDAKPAWRVWLGRGLDWGLWALVIGLLVWRFGPQVGAAIGLGGMNEPAPDFAVRTFEGDSIRLSELRGQVVLVNFWATWCAPCRVEMPGFQDVWEDYRDRGVVILGLSIDRGDRSAVERWVREREYTYPMGFPTGATVRALGGADVVPTSLLIDRDGNIRHRVEGFYAEPALRAAINRLLE